MRRRTAGKVAKPKVCAFCGSPIAEIRPVFLVATGKGAVVGPYHAGCCERLVLAHKGKMVTQAPLSEEYGRILLPSREETLPW